MTTTEIAAQAGDEPMDYAAQLRAAVETVCEGWTLPAGVRKTLEAALWAPQVSPRATADVDRDAARYRWLRNKANSEPNLAPMVFNVNPEEELDWMAALYGESLDAVMDVFVATTKPGA